MDKKIKLLADMLGEEIGRSFSVDEMASLTLLERDPYETSAKAMLLWAFAKRLFERGIELPPVNVGRTVWRLGDPFDEPTECTVTMIQQKKDGTWKFRLTGVKHPLNYDHFEEDVGHVVFFNEAEAEKASVKAKINALAAYGGMTLPFSWLIEDKSFYCHNCYRGANGEEIYAISDDEGSTEYYYDGILFAESFTNEGDKLRIVPLEWIESGFAMRIKKEKK